MRFLDAQAVAGALDRRRLIDRLDAAFAAGAAAPVRSSHDLGPDPRDAARRMLLTMPAWSARALGVKLVTIFEGNARRALPAVHGCYLLFDADGIPRAVLDGTELTRRRTGAASALAARYLARTDARRLLMVGTGALAPHLIESHALARPIDSVRIWGRRPARAAELAARLTRPGLDVEPCEDLRAGVAWADLVSCATLSREPLVEGAWLKAGQHLDLVGSFRPDMREVDDNALERATIYVDTRAGALEESGELIAALARGRITPTSIRGELRELVRGLCPARQGSEAITLFKSVGTALEDLAAAELAVEEVGRAPQAADPTG